MSAIVNAEAFKEGLYEALARHGVSEGAIEFVDGFPNDANPRRVSMCFKIEKRILLKKGITPEDRADAVNLYFGRFPEKHAELEDGALFVKAVFLYEMFHIVYRYQTDYECAKWALYYLKK